MRTYPPYPAYRASGVEWLGEIPEHWEVHRLKNVARILFSNVDKLTVDDEQPVLLCNYIDVYKNESITHELEFMKASATGEEIRKFSLEKSDVLITKDSESWNDIAIPALVSDELENVLCGYHLAMIRSNSDRIDERYLFRSLQSRQINYQLEVEATGVTRYGIDQYAVRNSLVLLPPLSEQRAIAGFLDRETARIDALTARYRRLIELLNEKRTSLISRAVTKGLDPSAALKDSGVEWLGEIPEHWGISKIKFVSSINMGQSPNSEECNQNRIGKPFLQGNAEFGRASPIPRNYCETAKKEAHPGDYLLSVRAPVGALNVADQIYGIGRGLCAIRPHSKILEHRFTWYLLTFYRKQLEVVSTGSTYDAVSIYQVGNAICVLPTLSEQRAIAGFLDRETARIDTLKEKALEMINKLQEYRTALISAAVTGKIDVRNEGEQDGRNL